MKKAKWLLVLTVLSLALTACSNNASGNSESEASQSQETQESTKVEKPASEKSMMEQGNPTSINLVDIVEEGTDCFNAWIKISTAFDPELSMYACDVLPEGTEGIIVTFNVKDMDCEPVELYWCYQVICGGETISVWDTSSSAEKLSVSADGTYTMVFDAQKALGGSIDKIESLQIVFPGLTETTATKFEVTKAVYVTDAKDVAAYTTGAVE